jgi:hypothetical protein
MKFRVLWDVAPCSLGVDRRFRVAYCHHHKITHHPDDGGSSNSETSVYSNENTRRYIPEDSKLHSNNRLMNNNVSGYMVLDRRTHNIHWYY